MTDEILNTTLKKIGELKLVDYNPRKQDRKVTEKIKNSIREFGFVNPLVVNKNNNIIGGNQRYVALKELYGPDKEVPVVMLDLDNDKEKALNIALNKISSDWDFNKLTPLLTSLNNLSLSDITGFDKTELNIMDIGVTMPEIEINPSAKIIRYPLTFFFDNVEDKIAVENYFLNKKFGWQGNKEPNSLQLMDIIKPNIGRISVCRECGSDKGCIHRKD